MQVLCRKCKRETHFRRVNRHGWLERQFLSTYFRLFPWECVICRDARYFRIEHDEKQPETSTSATDSHTSGSQA